MNILSNVNSLIQLVKNGLMAKTVFLRNVNDQEKQEMLSYGDLVWILIEDAYRPIGGYKGATSVEHLVSKSFLWRVVFIQKDEKDIPAVVNVYKKEFGLKRIATAVTIDKSLYPLKTYKNEGKGKGLFNKLKNVVEVDGSYYSNLNSIAKDSLTKLYQNDLDLCWAELSGASEKFLLNNVHGVDNYKIPSEIIKKALGDEVFIEDDDIDGYTYTRIFQGEKHKKRAYGTIKI